ncbi:UDP-N-acetylmuramate dehydrogenase [Photobacterium galatheae]|uniref:UDP-N-acetylenolpyruvoylglucosamine reductase n=1 Tax=Photobacterium galatheae TaxID=1654360 RepID=A0A066RQJ9_9GAMM|nr:UDP-N-acetylmuramate dehydrogenase [Photobacterium galatheae]KDM89653.1 UDP-N-acetylenolpyruvoylglucosamine reductase [Photobacterium galatheae]MCM0151729.1 UDP-N-acetylmuramate dehydrogenase [Photobacterium galatheae]
MEVLHSHSLAQLHTFGIQVQASRMAAVSTADELKLLLSNERLNTPPPLIIGQGSNLLFCSDFQGAVILNRIMGVVVSETDYAYHLHVGAGENWHQLVCWTVEQGMPGLENLALIPGCVGSAPIQNIGAYGVELQDVCEYVEVMDRHLGEVQRLSADDCCFGYRDSIFKHALKDTHIIIAVGIRLSKDWLPKTTYGPLANLNPETVTAKEILAQVCAIRRAKLPDPAQLGNAGSFFKNPIVPQEKYQQLSAVFPGLPSYPAQHGHYKLAAGWLIDQCGLKGYQIGGAAVHKEQALVIVNTGSATSEDVLRLARHIVDTVACKFGVRLEHEVRFMGANGETTLDEVMP